MLKELIGAQLICIDNSGFIVILPDKKIRCFDFYSNNGNDYGYAEIKGKMWYKPKSDKQSIITNIIIIENISQDYGSTIKVNFFGGNKLLADIESKAGSKSSRYHGASTWLFCKETKETKTLAEW